MSVRVTEQGLIELSGPCGADDAEVLQRCLLTAQGSTVEWSECEQIHAAVLQVLLAAKPAVTGSPKNAFLRAHVAPLLEKGSSGVADR